MAIPAAIPTEMRALVLGGTGFENLAVRRVPVPRPGPRQVLARVDAAGVCTSLLKLIAQGSQHNLMSGWDIERFPIILGDEGCVTIVAVGTELADRFAVGRRCVVQPAVDHPPVHNLERYRNGGRGVSKVALSYTLPGHLAEYVLITEETIGAGCVVPLPDEALPFAHAAIAEPISCCVSSQEHHLHLVQEQPTEPRTVAKGLRAGGVTVIIGAGVMGRMHVDVALTQRPRAVVICDLVPERLRRVEALFSERAAAKRIALYAANTAEQDLRAFVAELTNDRGADDVIVAVGSKAAVESAQALCGRGAVLNLFGGLPKGDHIVSLDSSIIHYREINVTGSSGGSPADIRKTLALMANREVETAAHITRIGDLEHAAEFLRMIQAQELDGRAVVYPHRHTDRILAVDSWRAEDEKEYLRTSPG